MNVKKSIVAVTIAGFLTLGAVPGLLTPGGQPSMIALTV